MGDKIEALSMPGWVLERRPLKTRELSERVNFSVEEILKLVNEGVLKPILGKRPYRFDPLHVYQVFFEPPKQRSLKIKEYPHSHKSVKGRDLWL